MERIGRYEILGELGEGGMAKVMLAHDPRFKREVAIKILPRHVLANNMLQERFEREAHTIAALEHSAIVPVYDYGESEGQPFLVMRQMRGGSLSDRIKQAPLDVLAASRIVDRIASALDKAHARGVIHRDLKPGNILFDEDGAPFLSDFGIVKVMEGTTGLTSGIIGTPGYMAPEMFGESKLTPLIDVYALGITLFQMLTGRLPYRGETPVAIMYAHINEPIPDIRALRSELPDAIQDIIERSMAKSPADRYQTAGEMAQALRSVARMPAPTTRNEPVFETEPMPSPSRGEATVLNQPPRAASGRALPLGIGAAVLALMLIGVIIAAVLLINGLPESPGGSANASITPENTSAATDELTSAPTDPPTAEIAATTAATDEATQGVAATTATTVPLGYPGNPVTENAQWEPVIQAFDGVQMALAPVGCGVFGSVASDRERGGSEVLPYRVCFEAPFWIDVYEVTNAQFASFGGQAASESAFAGDQQPRERVSWDEAVAYCELRGMRLPTEDEWEYAVRGPDSLMYPWGDEFISENAVYNGNASSQTANVGSIPAGASWLGVFDLAGNVFEWVLRVPEESGQHQLRGGGWCSDSQVLRAPFKTVEFPLSPCADRGLRCAQDWVEGE